MSDTRPESPATTGRPPSRRGGLKLWAFRLVAMTAVPLAFFALVEGGLRLAGYGYPTRFFVRAATGDGYVTNDRFGWRFFPRSIAREPLMQVLPAEKPPGTYRVFVLGGSAAQGYPDPAYGFGRVLEVMLEQAYPETEFEVVNAAMTAVNSHVVRLIARDCAAFEPDLFVVYLGNNEVVGPFGPGTVFEGFSPSGGAIRASLGVRTLRLGQLAATALGEAAAARDETDWRGLEMFVRNRVAADDPRLATTYEHFRENLVDICRTGRAAGAEVLLCTVAVNLREHAPFASDHATDLPAAQREEWVQRYAVATTAAREGRVEVAIPAFEHTAEIDDRHAELAFRLAQALAAAGATDEARPQFVRARDLDTLRFRADSRINEVIAQVAAEHPGVHLADTVAALAGGPETPDGMPGLELFHEHVHLNFTGAYRVAAAVLEQLVPRLPTSVTNGRRGSWPSIAQCAEALALTAWDEYKIAGDVAAMTTRAPFTNQFDHEVRTAERARRRAQLADALTPSGLANAMAQYARAIERRPDDLLLRQKAAHLAYQVGDVRTAMEHWEAVLERMPENWAAQNSYGLVLAAIGELEEAKSRYRRALSLWPGYADAHNNLGTALAIEGALDAAVAQYRLALASRPGFAEAHYNLGLALKGQGDLDGAIASYRRALELQPDAASIHHNLANALQLAGRVEPSLVHYRKALELRPRNPQAHRNLGVALRALGRLDEAIGHFETALEQSPDFAEARQDLIRTRQMAGP